MLTTVCRNMGMASKRLVAMPLFRFSSSSTSSTISTSTSTSTATAAATKKPEESELAKKKKQLAILAQALSDSEEQLKRTQREIKELKEYGSMKFAKEMLEVMDNIEQLQGYMFVKLILEATTKAASAKATSKKSSTSTTATSPAAAAASPKVVVTPSSSTPKAAAPKQQQQQQQERPKMTETEQICSALNIIAKDFAMRLTRQGISPIPDPMGKKFDPRYHNAVAELAKSAVDGGGRITAVPPPSSSSLSSNDDLTVMQVVKRGYMYKGRLLRPANVAVSRNSRKKPSNKK